MNKNGTKTNGTENNGEPKNKVGFKDVLGGFAMKHPKITKAAKVTGKVVLWGFAIIGGAGVAKAIKDRDDDSDYSTESDYSTVPETVEATDEF